MSSSGRRGVIVLATLLLFVLAVTIASTGSVPAGSGGARRPSEQVLDVVFSLFLLLMGFGALLWGYVFLAHARAPKDVHGGQRRRSLGSFVGLLLFVCVLALALRWVSNNDTQPDGSAGDPGLTAPSAGGAGDQDASRYEPEFAAAPVVVVLGVLIVVGSAWYLSARARRRRHEDPPESLLPQLADVLDETLDDLRAEADPRRAVIAAYARMERALAASGLPRSPAEAPDEYLSRILRDLEVSRSATSSLTALFGRAKFSSHDVDPAMKEEAISALEAVREDLRAAELLAEHRRTTAAAPHHGLGQ